VGDEGSSGILVAVDNVGESVRGRVRRLGGEGERRRRGGERVKDDGWESMMGVLEDCECPVGGWLGVERRVGRVAAGWYCPVDRRVDSGLGCWSVGIKRGSGMGRRAWEGGRWVRFGGSGGVGAVRGALEEVGRGF
jgi:hypothetical protein